MAKRRSTERAAESPATDDALAFRAAVRGVTPLAQTAQPEGLSPPVRRIRRRKRADEPIDLAADMPLIDPLPGADALPAISGAEPLAYHRPGVRTDVVRRLRRGLIPLEDELDLHGLTQSIARDHLAQFLRHSRESGRRCVRIIHGKGYRSGTRGPILKMAVDLWLRRHLDVMAFTSARPIDGGTGAVYVLLRP